MRRPEETQAQTSDASPPPHLHAVFRLPFRWEDLGQVVDRIDGPPREYANGPVARPVFRLRDATGTRIGVTLFGGARHALLASPQREPIVVTGRPAQWNGRWWLNQARIVPAQWVGRLRPVYPSHKQRDKELDAIVDALPALIPESAAWLASRLRAVQAQLGRPLPLPGRRDLEGLLYRAYLPDSVEGGYAAQRRLERLAALDLVAQMQPDGATRAGWASPAAWEGLPPSCPSRSPASSVTPSRKSFGISVGRRRCAAC